MAPGHLIWLGSCLKGIIIICVSIEVLFMHHNDVDIMVVRLQFSKNQRFPLLRPPLHYAARLATSINWVNNDGL